MADAGVGVAPTLFKLFPGFLTTFIVLTVVLEDTDVSLAALFGFDADLLLYLDCNASKYERFGLAPWRGTKTLVGVWAEGC